MNRPSLLSKGILIIAKKISNGKLLKRVTSHVTGERAVDVNSFVEAEVEIMRREPSAVIIDVTDYPSAEFRRRVEPFVLGLPGWIKVFLVDGTPSLSRLRRARDIGVRGILKSPLSHHGISQLVNDPPLDERLRR